MTGNDELDDGVPSSDKEEIGPDAADVLAIDPRVCSLFSPTLVCLSIWTENSESRSCGSQLHAYCLRLSGVFLRVRAT